MKDVLKNLALRIAQTKDRILTEEATKNAYIMPFLQILGYDVFNPLEIVPEFSAAQGVKEADKVDYAIFIDNKPAILVECKPCNSELCIENEGQLMRYFSATEAKFGILTNGIEYRIYSDLQEPNILDKTPFLSFRLDGDLEKINYTELAKFSKANFDAVNVRRTAEMMKSTNDVTAALKDEFANPSEDFVRLLFKKFSKAPFTPTQRDKYLPLVKTCLDAIINGMVKASLDAALKHNTEEQEAQQAQQAEITMGPETGIVTTEEEMEAFRIVKSIGAEIVTVDKLALRDAKSYCMVNLDDNNRKPVIRFWFNNFAKSAAITLFDGALEEKIAITKVEDIYNFKERILNTIKKYLPKPEAQA